MMRFVRGTDNGLHWIKFIPLNISRMGVKQIAYPTAALV